MVLHKDGIRLLMHYEQGERHHGGGRGELQVWDMPWRAPGPMGQMDVGDLRMFLLPARDSYTRQSVGAMEDLGS